MLCYIVFGQWEAIPPACNTFKSAGIDESLERLGMDPEAPYVTIRDQAPLFC